MARWSLFGGRVSGRLKAALLFASALALGFWIGFRQSDPPERLIFFSVGQGDCALLQAGGSNILIDAGPANEYSDAGRTLIYPKLRELGVDRIDIAILSHPDTDHIGGLVSLSQRMRIETVAVPGHFSKNKTLAAVLERSRIPASKVLWVNRGMEILSGKWRLRMASPPYGAGDSDNNGSLFVWIGKEKASAVFSGDADMLTEASMIPRGSWKAQVMKAGHHGSKFSTGPEWLDAVQPQFVIFSCGRNNTYGHPSAEALARVKESGAQALRTDRDGTITFRVGERGFELVKR